MEEIKIQNLTDEDIGRPVEYKRGKIKEKGILKSWNMVSLFIVFKCEDPEDFQNSEAMACHPFYVRFIKKNEYNESEEIDDDQD